MKLSFHGAARTVTGSKHIVHINGRKILLDCGLFQGMGRETLQMNSEWGFEPREIDVVILSHAHIDHIGLLPKLVKDGYTGKIYCTTQTAELAKLLLADSAHIQEMDVMHVNRIREREKRPLVEPLYTEMDAMAASAMLEGIPYGEHYRIAEDIELLYTNCGHLLGSAAVNLRMQEDGEEITLAFSGDIGRYSDMILRAPEVFPQADYIIMESTYGDKLHNMMISATEELLKHIEQACVENKGKLIIPAFSVGRTQEILFMLNRLDLEKRLPQINYFIDSPLSIKATEIIKQHPECFNDHVKLLLEKDEDVFSFVGLHYTESAPESISLTDREEPCVIIAASGMAEAGRIKHHIAQCIDNPQNTILLVGYCEPHSLGGKLKNGATNVTIYGDPHEVKATIATIDSMSAHGDYDDMCRWISCQDAEKVKRVFLVHGEYETQVAFRERLMRKGFANVEIPTRHQEVELGAAVVAEA